MAEEVVAGEEREVVAGGNSGHHCRFVLGPAVIGSIGTTNEHQPPSSPSITTGSYYDPVVIPITIYFSLPSLSSPSHSSPTFFLPAAQTASREI